MIPSLLLQPYALSELDYKALSFWWMVAQTVVLIFTAIYTWWSNRERVSASAIEEAREKITELERDMEMKLMSLKKDLEHLPKKEDIRRIYEKIESQGLNLSEKIEVQGRSLSDMHGEMRGISKQLHLINQHLISSDAKK